MAHQGEKPYKCKSCPSTFSSKATLAKHTRKHTGEKPYKCEHCGKSFGDKFCMTRHLKIHTGEKQFKCRFCDYSSHEKHNIVIHERTHTGEKPYKCQLCSYATYHGPNLTIHEKVMHAKSSGDQPTSAREYKCTICPKVYESPASLHYHKGTHTGLKRYKCSYCEYSAFKNFAIDQHEQRMHTREKHFPKEPFFRTTTSPFVVSSNNQGQTHVSRSEENPKLSKDQQQSSVSSQSICRVCEFQGSDADVALHMSVLHKLPVVALQRIPTESKSTALPRPLNRVFMPQRKRSYSI